MTEKEQYYEWLYKSIDDSDVWAILRNDPNIQKRFSSQRTSSVFDDGLIHWVSPNFQSPVANYGDEIRKNIKDMMLNSRLNGAGIGECGKQLDYILTDKGRHDLLAKFAEKLGDKLGDSAVLEVIDEFLNEAEDKGHISGRLTIKVEPHHAPWPNHVEGNYEVKLLSGNSGEGVLFDDSKWDKWGKLLYLFFLLHPGEEIPRNEIPTYENQLISLYWEAFRRQRGVLKSDVLSVIEKEIQDFLEQLYYSGNDKFSHAKSMANKAVKEALEGYDDEKWYIIDTIKDGQKAVYILRTPQENIELPEELEYLKHSY